MPPLGAEPLGGGERAPVRPELVVEVRYDKVQGIAFGTGRS